MKKIIATLSALIMLLSASAQDSTGEQKYRRSSLYSILVSHNHDKAKYHKEIEEVFSIIPIPDKFDNHDLSVKIITSKEKEATQEQITAFLERNRVAHRLVGRWFNRNPKTGECNMELIAERGLYDATYFDVELAKMSQRGYSMLADAGEEIIGNTFVIVNDIRYNDRSKAAKIAGIIIKALEAYAQGASGNTSSSSNDKSLGDLIADIKGFGVHVTTYLYRLEWNDDIAREFYTNHYVDAGHSDAARRDAFRKSDLYTLKFIGSRKVSSGNIAIKGTNEYDPIQMVRKVCTRAIDESIVALQRDYDEFKIKTPIYSVEPTITAKIGLKEGVAKGNKYEVLEQVINKEGRTEYRRVGIIEPIDGFIWDNRYMAFEEQAAGSNLNSTTFRKVSGGDFYEGMLIREVKVK